MCGAPSVPFLINLVPQENFTVPLGWQVMYVKSFSQWQMNFCYNILKGEFLPENGKLSMVILTPDSSDCLCDPTYSCINTEKADSYKRKVKVGEDVCPGGKNNDDMSQIMLQ